MRSLADIAVHFCLIKRRSAGNVFLNALTNIYLLEALVIEGLIKWGSKYLKKSPVVFDGYVKYEEAEILRSAIMQDFRENKKN